MFLSDASVRRPVAMSCLIIALTLLGLNAWRKMSLELMPTMDVPFITILTTYPGASPEEIEVEVAKRIEDAVGTIDGIKHITSTCMPNLHQALLEFQLGTDVDIAATQVSRKLDTILEDLPDGAEKPTVQVFDVNASPVLTMALTGDAPLAELYDYADNQLSDRLTVISGVAEVQLTGGSELEVQVLLDREALAARGLRSLDVVGALQGGLGKLPAGNVRGAGMEYSVKFDADFAAAAALGDLIIDVREGRRTYLRDVAAVSLAPAELRKSAALDGRTAVAIKVVKKSDANAVEVVDNVRAALDRLADTMPGGMELVWVTDDATFIRASNDSAWINVAQGIALTAAVLFLFLYDLRALVVVSITMPLTVVIALFVMSLIGYSLNTSTLIAIGMSVGILVTNSIVVLESIVSRLNRGLAPREAASLGASESFIAVLASAGTNMVVLLPLAMMKNKIGSFIGPLALTMFIMTVVSLFISFTLTPMLCSLLLKSRQGERRGVLAWMESRWNGGFDRVIGGIRRVLQFNERHRLAAVGVLVLTAVLFMHAMSRKVGFGFFPDSDRGDFYVKLEYPTYYDLAHTQRAVAEAEKRLARLPHLQHQLTTCGRVQGVIGQASEGVYLAQMLLHFNDRTQREESADDLLAMIRETIAELPEPIATTAVTSIIGGQSSPVEMEIYGDDLDELDALASQAVELARAIPGFRDVDSTVREGKPELRVTPRRAVLADLGHPASELGLTLRGNIEGLDAGDFIRGDRSYDITVKFAERPGSDQVAAFELPGGPGRPVRLETVAEVEHRMAPIQIIRKNKQRVSKLYANLDSSVPLGTAINQLSAAVNESIDLPPGYGFRFTGVFEVMAEALGGFGEAMLVAIVLVVLTLSAILESFRQPWLILVTLPLALIGVMWALALTGEAMGMFVIMGLVMMVGIVVNNAILIMDQFNVHVREGIPRHRAMITATCEQMRPVIMITIAAVLGMLPLALGRGVGAELRNGVGIASVGGILVSGVLTLLLLPILYDLCTRTKKAAKTQATAEQDDKSPEKAS